MEDFEPRDAGRLLNIALNPKSSTRRDPEYRELMELYQSQAEFRQNFAQFASGLGLEVLDYDSSGLVLGTRSYRARLALRLTELRRSYTWTDNAALALVLVTVITTYYPDANALDDPDSTLDVGALTPVDILTVLRKNLLRLADEEAREQVDPLGTVETGWRYLDGLPEGRPGGEEAANKGTQLGLIRTALQLLAAQGLLDEQEGTDPCQYLATQRFRIQAKQLTLDVLNWLLSDRGDDESPHQ